MCMSMLRYQRVQGLNLVSHILATTQDKRVQTICDLPIADTLDATRLLTS